MKRIGIICKTGRPEPAEILKELVPWLLKRGVDVCVEQSADAPSGAKKCPPEEMTASVDMILVLGGDGTLLGAARLAAEHNVPLLGVNLGGLGFITEVYKHELYDVMQAVLDCNCPTQERIMLEARLIRNGIEKSRYIALNDIVITKGNLAKIIDLDINVNGTYVTMFKADGVIAATPTGSTAYSMSAGGPIIYPTADCIALTPICPHMLTNRPLVLTGDTVIEVSLKSASEGVMLTHDGLVAENIIKDDRVVIGKSKHVTTLLIPTGRDHFQVLRNKLKWGER